MQKGNALIKTAEGSQVVLDLPSEDKAKICSSTNMKLFGPSFKLLSES